MVILVSEQIARTAPVAIDAMITTRKEQHHCGRLQNVQSLVADSESEGGVTTEGCRRRQSSRQSQQQNGESRFGGHRIFSVSKSWFSRFVGLRGQCTLGDSAGGDKFCDQVLEVLLHVMIMYSRAAVSKFGQLGWIIVLCLFSCAQQADGATSAEETEANHKQDCLTGRRRYFYFYFFLIFFLWIALFVLSRSSAGHH